ncbi:hypothetical protein E2C01_007857 [Portunus trituberculatus]|uniref:Uncharacterized protein n=1 Tax=Portunus trituberculatus TaxID=210409 RepID=A0A5B7D181_PORTR|nr:hypothetical protein [Portunus trituberculatus]
MESAISGQKVSVISLSRSSANILSSSCVSSSRARMPAAMEDTDTNRMDKQVKREHQPYLRWATEGPDNSHLGTSKHRVTAWLALTD